MSAPASMTRQLAERDARLAELELALRQIETLSGPHYQHREIARAALERESSRSPDLNWHWTYCPECGAPTPRGEAR